MIRPQHRQRGYGQLAFGSLELWAKTPSQEGRRWGVWPESIGTLFNRIPMIPPPQTLRRNPAGGQRVVKTNYHPHTGWSDVDSGWWSDLENGPPECVVEVALPSRSELSEVFDEILVEPEEDGCFAGLRPARLVVGGLLALGVGAGPLRRWLDVVRSRLDEHLGLARCRAVLDLGSCASNRGRRVLARAAAPFVRAAHNAAVAELELHGFRIAETAGLRALGISSGGDRAVLYSGYSP